MDPLQVLAILRSHKGELNQAGVASLTLFGSTVRGEAGPDSDVDLLASYDASRRISLLDIAGIQLKLSALLGRNVDLVEEGTLRPKIRSAVQIESMRAF